jgi:HKD family nuclease
MAVISRSHGEAIGVAFHRREHRPKHHCAAVHAEVVIGVGSAIIGSANLTQSGVLHRHEMAVVVEALSTSN